MECFGTTGFDNNSRLITLSAIITSGLHCTMLCCIIHCMSDYKFLVVWGFGFSQLWCLVTMLMFPNVWRSIVPSSSRVEGSHHQNNKKNKNKNLNPQQWPCENLSLTSYLLTFEFISSFLLRNSVCRSKIEIQKNSIIFICINTCDRQYLASLW
jgi:hypothetical protein